MLGRLFLCLGLAALLFTQPQPVYAQEPSVDPVLAAVENGARSAQSRLQFDGAAFSGPAWDQLLKEARAAQFFLIGEEHGIAENPKLAAALFKDLSRSGYGRLVIETSPTMATRLDRAIHKGGMDGLRRLFAEPGGEPAFFGMREEAEMLVAIRNAVATDQPVFWGVDYEVLSDRQLIAALQAAPKPPAAQKALNALATASNDAWAKHRETGNPGFIFSFSGDPGLVRAVRDAWPDRDEDASLILRTLEETLEINAMFVKGQNWASNSRRATFIRKSFLAHWNAAAAVKPLPKVMVKMGASHLVRGRSTTEAFDLGALLPELAEINGTQIFSLLVIPGDGAQTAVFDPVKLTYRPASPKDGYAKDLAPLVKAAPKDGFTLIDLRPLRGIKGLTRPTTNANLLRAIMGYDMLLVMTGSTAAGTLTD